jgi:hypothetical protein
VLGSLFNHVDNMSLFFPCEFTPQYIGIPPVFPNEQANKTVGGGFVDPVVSSAAGAPVSTHACLLAVCARSCCAQDALPCTASHARLVHAMHPCRRASTPFRPTRGRGCLQRLPPAWARCPLALRSPSQSLHAAAACARCCRLLRPPQLLPLRRRRLQLLPAAAAVLCARPALQ